MGHKSGFELRRGAGPQKPGIGSRNTGTSVPQTRGLKTGPLGHGKKGETAKKSDVLRSVAGNQPKGKLGALAAKGKLPRKTARKAA